MSKVLTDVWERAVRRPWLLVPPLLGMLVQNVVFLVASGSVAVQMALTSALTSAVAAVFAELWLGDGWSADPARLLDAWRLYFIPYALLLVFGAVTAPVAYWSLHADLPRGIAMSVLFGVIALGKLSAFALGAGSSLALVRRPETERTLDALRLGFSTLYKNAAFFAPALLGAWLFEEACVYLARTLAPGLLGAYLTTAIPLLGCVAIPLEAWRAGRLSKA